MRLEVPAMSFLLSRQVHRVALEGRAILSLYLASFLLGLFMAWLLSFPEVATPVAAFSALFLLILVRGLSDASVVQQLLLGGAWREIRLSRLSSHQVVTGIYLDGMVRTLRWALVPAIGVELSQPGYGLAWMGLVLLGGSVASILGSLSVVQKLVSPRLRRQEQLIVLGLALFFFSLPLPWTSLILPAILLAAWAGLRLCAIGLDLIPEGATTLTPSAGSGRWLRWVSSSENPIVARECARESRRLGKGWLGAQLYFLGWGLLWLVLPLACLALTYWAWDGWPIWVEVWGVFALSGYLLLISVLQAFRSSQRVFGALSEERDCQTLDLLVVTSLDPEDFVDGWAEVGYTTRQWEMAVLTMGCLLSAYAWLPSLVDLALLVYSGLLGICVCVAGAYVGLLLGIRHCGRVKRKRDMVFPICLLLWTCLTAPLFLHAWWFLLIQAGAVYLVIQNARRQAIQALGG